MVALAANEYHKLWPATCQQLNMEDSVIIDTVEEATAVDLEPTAVTQVDLDLEDPDPVSAVESEASSSCTILDKLKAPTKSDLSRKRKIEKPKTAQLKKHKSSVTNQTDPKSVSPAQRVKDFPNECLEVKNGTILYCLQRGACSQKEYYKESH